MKRLRQIFGFNSIRKKLLIYFLVATCIIGFSSIYTFYISNRFLHQMDTMFTSSIMLDELETNLNAVETNLLNFLSTKQSDNLNNYIYYSEELQRRAREIHAEIGYDKTHLLLKDIGNMIETYLDAAGKAVEAKRGRYINEYIQQYQESNKVATYIREYIHRLKEDQLNMNTKNYTVLSSNLRVLQVANSIIIFSTIGLSILIVVEITYTITSPITKLAQSANELSKGNFEVREIHVSSHDEVKVLADAFDQMKHNIRRYIEELKLSAQTEAKLMDEEMKNLRMRNLLGSAELQALQSQINPHFLFNTLNAGVQLAMMEGADRTGEFLESMSALFRYNIKKLDNPVLLKEEIKNVRAYYDLLNVRFGDMLNMEYNIDEKGVGIQMPPLILQPLVENSFIHGVGDYENGGKVKICVIAEENYVEVSIEDNGKGMDGETIGRVFKEALFNKEGNIPKKAKKGHTTGIGLPNVIHRLTLFYNKKNIVKIYSDLGRGTRIVLQLPYRQDESVY